MSGFPNMGGPAQPPYHGRGFGGGEWNMKQPQERSRGMMAPQQQPGPGWECAQGWQGQLGPNLMPMTAARDMPRGGGMQNMQNMQNGGPPQNMQNMQEPSRGGHNMHDLQRGNMPNMPMQEPFGGMQNMRNIYGEHARATMQDLQGGNMQNLPPMQNMQNGMGLNISQFGQEMAGRQGPKVMEVPTLQPQPVSAMNSMQSQLTQVIALPVGAPPPEGAIPMGMQMIAVPAGEAPPEGAIPVPQSDSPSTKASSKAFKIKDPRTGLEVHAPSEETAAAPRRLRIVNPKTGEEVRPSL